MAPKPQLDCVPNPVYNEKKKKLLPQARIQRAGQQPTVAAMGSGGPIPSPPKGKLPPVEAQKNQQTEEILNSILPPREWSEGGKLWVQCVSSTPATRLDVINQQEQLDTRLQQRQARETGICPVRRELYSQCFGQYMQCVIVGNVACVAMMMVHQPEDWLWSMQEPGL